MAAADATNVVVARDLTKRFGGENGVTALDRVSLSIAPGEFVSFLGPSGCGKSTFLRCMAGLEEITEGDLLIDGGPVRGTPEGLGIAFQRDALLDWFSILDNVLLPAEFGGLRKSDYEPRARELLRRVGLEDFAGAFPSTLSGGMRQRAAISRALLMTPRLLLMDEPFGALDALTRDQLNVDLRQLWQVQRMTTVFVTHSISEAVFLSSRVVVLSPRPGRIFEDVVLDLPQERDLDLRETPGFLHYSRHFRRSFERLGLIHG